MSALGRWPYPFWLAHRGAGKLAPENTLAAFRVGAAHGFRAFECDVKLSADDVPFLLHDATLQRTTCERGVAGERAWSALSRIDAGAWHGRTHAGEPLPSLAAIAAFVRANGFAIDIEIKPTPGLEAHTGRVVARETAALWADEADADEGADEDADAPPLPLPLPLLSSFSVAALEGARETAPHLPRALLADTLRAGWLDDALALGCVAVIANYAVMGRDAVQRLHASGLRALVYTANDPSVVAWLRSIGIDGIITDAVDRFAPVA